MYIRINNAQRSHDFNYDCYAMEGITDTNWLASVKTHSDIWLGGSRQNKITTQRVTSISFNN